MPYPSFQPIKTQAPWYKKPSSLAACAFFILLGASAAFLLKGDEDTLLKRVQSSDPVSPVCAYALGWRGIQKDSTRVAFEEILATGESEKPAPDEVRRACAYGLGRVHDSKSLFCLIDAVRKDPDVPVRCAAVRALGKLAEPRGCEPLMDAFSDGDSRVRAAAADAAVSQGDKRALDKLIDHIDDGDPAVRRACHEALVAMTGTSFDGTDERRLWRQWRESH